MEAWPSILDLPNWITKPKCVRPAALCLQPLAYTKGVTTVWPSAPLFLSLDYTNMAITVWPASPSTPATLGRHDHCYRCDLWPTPTLLPSCDLHFHLYDVWPIPTSLPPCDLPPLSPWPWAYSNVATTLWLAPLSRCNPGETWVCKIRVSDFFCWRFLLFHREADLYREVDQMLYLFGFIIVTACGRSKVESRELSNSVFRFLILLFYLSHVLYNPVP